MSLAAAASHFPESSEPLYTRWSLLLKKESQVVIFLSLVLKYYVTIDLVLISLRVSRETTVHNHLFVCCRSDVGHLVSSGFLHLPFDSDNIFFFAPFLYSTHHHFLFRTISFSLSLAFSRSQCVFQGHSSTFTKFPVWNQMIFLDFCQHSASSSMAKPSYPVTPVPSAVQTSCHVPE